MRTEQEYRNLEAENARLAAEVERLTKEIDSQIPAGVIQKQMKAIATLQARIDELMLEYCPDEMTPEQLDEWARHQIPAPEAGLDALPAAGQTGKGGAE